MRLYDGIGPISFDFEEDQGTMERLGRDMEDYHSQAFRITDSGMFETIPSYSYVSPSPSPSLSYEAGPYRGRDWLYPTYDTHVSDDGETLWEAIQRMVERLKGNEIERSELTFELEIEWL